MVSGDNDSRTRTEPSKMQPMRIKTNLAKKQAMFTNMDTEKPEEVESLEEAAFKPLLCEKSKEVSGLLLTNPSLTHSMLVFFSL